MKYLLIALFGILLLAGFRRRVVPPEDNRWTTPFERSGGKASATYDECMAYYKQLADAYDQLKILPYGNTSIGKPLQLVVIDKDKAFTPASAHQHNKRILLINNGIHPGEPDGVDACMMLARDLVQKDELNKLLDHVVVCIIPVYNISGCLNRGISRPNQNGPLAYGFRGNAQNLDLNRDFLKCDAPESASFNALFCDWQPELLIDTHVSDGADYPYVMTYIATQKDKLNASLANYLINKLQPALDKSMKDGGFECCPYVDTKASTPDSGLVGYLETPRYSTGYAALHNCIGFVAETHMLKPYQQRVEATYLFCEQLLRQEGHDFQLLGELKKKADDETCVQATFGLHWSLNDSTFDKILFRGYTAKYKTSAVTGLPQLYYDEQQPWVRKIPFYNNYYADVSVGKPIAYLVPQACSKIISLMKVNGVQMKQLSRDLKVSGGIYTITSYKSSSQPYENHFLHRQVEVEKHTDSLQFYKGDYLIICNQPANRYIVESLEPQGVDSWFAWNAFDGILQEKEYFSDYVFDTVAVRLLQQYPDLRAQFDAKRQGDTAFAGNKDAQLFYIYQHSPYFEKSVNRYPVLRVETEMSLPVE